MFADAFGDFLSLHFGHDDVGEQDVDAAGVRGGGIECFLAAGRGQDLVAVAGQDAAGDLAQGVFVFGDQDSPAGAAAGIALVWRRFGGGALPGGGGQQQGDGGAVAWFGVDPDVAAGLGDDAVDSGQAQAGSLALGLGGVERLAGAGDDLGRHPGAGVADGHGDVAAGRQVVPEGGVGLVDLGVGGLDGQGPAAGHGVAGVDGEVDQDLLDLAGVGGDGGQVAGQVGGELDVLAEGPLEQLADVGDEVVEVQDAGLDDFPAGEGQQLAGQPGGAFGGLLDLPGIGPD